MRTLHVGLRVTDAERSLTFYRALGFQIVGTVPGTPLGDLTMLKLPDDEFVTLELVSPVRDGADGDHPGLSHVVIKVESATDAIADLASKDIHADAPTAPTATDEVWTAWITDPDGNRIELVQWPTGHSDGMSTADFSA